MKFSLTALIRLLIVTILGASTLAVGVSRLSPPMDSGRVDGGLAMGTVNGFLLSPQTSGSYWVDTRGGEVGRLAMPEGEHIDYASFSPWRESSGEAQVVGRWSKSGTETEGESASGLARLRFPSGEVLDRVETPAFPIGNPSWVPGRAARIVYVGSDGRLYYHAFELSAAETVRGEISPVPRAFRWASTPPGLGDVFVTDPTWLRDPRLGDVVVVALRYLEQRGDGARYSRSVLWWLRLDLASLAVVEHGPILDSEIDPGAADLRSPSFGVGPDGRLLLAYHRRGAGEGWELRVSPIEIQGRRPARFDRPGLLIARECQPGLPTFSDDRQGVYYVGQAPGGTALRRASIAGPEEGPGPDAQATGG